MPDTPSNYSTGTPANEPKIGSDWDGNLEGWLAAVGITKERDEDLRVQDWSFPTDALKREYISAIATQSEDQVIDLLRLFLFENASFREDERIIEGIIGEELQISDGVMREYRRRLMWHKFMSRGSPHPGVRWVLDMLSYNPRGAIDAINSYAQAHFQVLPDGRIDGLLDAVAVIRGRWLSESEEGRESLLTLSPRELERLVAALYARMGYASTLTPPGRDGGRDVIAERSVLGESSRVLIECKMYTRPVGVDLVRSLLGVVSNENANKGVLVTVSRFTKGAVAFSRRNPRIELIDGESLLRLLSEKFGTSWFRNRDSLTRAYV